MPGLIRLPVGITGRRPRRWSLALRLVIPVSIFVAWWVLTTTGVIPSTTLSTPAVTWDAFVQLWRHDDLLGDIGVSARVAPRWGSPSGPASASSSASWSG